MYDFLFFTNAKQPYAYHNKYYLALQTNLTYKFRWPKVYFNELDEAKIQNLTGKYGCLILRNYSTGSLIPLRRFRIHKLFNYGHTLYFVLEFLEYVTFYKDYGNEIPPNTIDIQCEYHEKLNNFLSDNDIDNTAESYIDKEIFKISKIQRNELDIQFCKSQEIEEQINCWSKLVFIVSHFKVFENESFYKISHITKLGKDNKKRLIPKNIKQENKGYLLKAGRVYTMEIIQFRPHYNKDKISENKYTLKYESINKHAEFLQTEYIIDHNFDRINICLTTYAQNNTNVNSIILISEEISKGDNIILPHFEINLLLKWKLLTWIWNYLVPPISFIMALFIYFGSSKILDIFCIQSLNEEHLRYIAIFLLSFSLGTWGSFMKNFAVKSE